MKRYPSEAYVFHGEHSAVDYEMVEPPTPCTCSDQCGGWTMGRFRRLDGTDAYPLWMHWLRPLTKAAREAKEYENATKWSNR